MKKLLVMMFCLVCLCACGEGGSSSTPQMVGSWSKKISTDAPLARSGHSAIWTGTEMIIWGGIDSNNNALNDGKIYNPVTGTWRVMSSVNAPSSRYYHTALWTGSKMLIWGGEQ